MSELLQKSGIPTHFILKRILSLFKQLRTILMLLNGSFLALMYHFALAGPMCALLS